MRTKVLQLLLTLLLVSFLSACSWTKKAAKKNPVPVPEVPVEHVAVPLEEIKQLNFEPEWFSASTRIDFKDQGSSTQFKANIRMRRDSAIWVSVSPTFLKVEVGRALITRDSVKVLDRMNKQVYLAGIDYIQEFTKYPFSFDDLQNLLLGNANLNPSTAAVEQNRDGYLLTEQDGNLLETAVYQPDPLQLNSLAMEDSVAGRKANCSFANYQSAPGGKFSTKRNIFLDAGYLYEVNLAFEKLEFNEALNLPFSHSSKYEIIRP